METKNKWIIIVLIICHSCISNHNIRINYDDPNAKKTNIEQKIFDKIKGKMICFENGFEQDTILIKFDNKFIDNKLIKYDTIKNYSYCLKYDKIDSVLKIKINKNDIKIAKNKVETYKFIYINKLKDKNNYTILLTNKPHLYK